MKIIISFLFACIVMPSLKATGLNGKYTIDPSGTGIRNFTSFRAAIKKLQDSGVSAAVIFNVADGKYNTSLEIDSIPGTSAINTVAFQSQSHDSTKVILDTTWTGTSSSYGYVLDFNNASYIIFREMTLSNYGSGNGNYGANVIELMGRSNHIIIENNVILAKVSTPSNGALVYNDIYGIENYNTIQNNMMRGNYYGILLEAPYLELETGNVVFHNSVDSSTNYGILTGYQDSLNVSSNSIFMPSGNYGLYVFGVSGNGSGLDSSFVINNFVTLLDTNGYAFYGYQMDMVNFYFNSIASYGYNHTSGASFYSYKSGVGARVVNNAFINLNGGEALYYSANSVFYSDYNDIYTKGSIIGNFVSTYCYKLSDWQATSGMDANSISGNPQFKNAKTGNLHYSGKSLIVSRKGHPMHYGLEDIDGDLRDSLKPSIGADEVPIPYNYPYVIRLDSPRSPICIKPNQNVYIRIGNFGIYNVKSPDTIWWSVNDTVQKPYIWSGKLAAGAGVQINLGTFKLHGKYSNYRFVFTVAGSLDTVYGTLSNEIYAGFNFKSPSCAGDITFLYDSSSSVNNPIKKYLWNFGNGHTSASVNPITVFLNPGKYNVSLKIADSAGCSDSVMNIIKVDTADASFRYKINGRTVDFTANDSTLKKYQWDFGDGVRKDTSAIVSHTYTTNSKFRVTLRASTPGGCITTYFDSVNVFLSGVPVNGFAYGINIYPNPFTSTTGISYSLTNSEDVDISIFDIMGRPVISNKKLRQMPGEYTFHFTPSEYGKSVSGIYFVKIKIREKLSEYRIINVK